MRVHDGHDGGSYTWSLHKNFIQPNQHMTRGSFKMIIIENKQLYKTEKRKSESITLVKLNKQIWITHKHTVLENEWRNMKNNYGP